MFRLKQKWLGELRKQKKPLKPLCEFFLQIKHKRLKGKFR